MAHSDIPLLSRSGFDSEGPQLSFSLPHSHLIVIQLIETPDSNFPFKWTSTINKLIILCLIYFIGFTLSSFGTWRSDRVLSCFMSYLCRNRKNINSSQTFSTTVCILSPTETYSGTTGSTWIKPCRVLTGSHTKPQTLACETNCTISEQTTTLAQSHRFCVCVCLCEGKIGYRGSESATTQLSYRSYARSDKMLTNKRLKKERDGHYCGMFSVCVCVCLCVAGGWGLHPYEVSIVKHKR